MKFNTQYEFFEKLMSLFGIKVVNVYKRITPKDKVPFAQYQTMNVNATYQVHVEQQSLYSMEDYLYQKFQLIFRTLMLQHKLLLKGKYGYNGETDKFRYFETANYAIKDTSTLQTITEVSICGINILGDLDILDNNICQLVEQWIKFDNDDIPYEKQIDHLTGTYEQILQFVRNKTIHSTIMGNMQIEFMKQYNITRGNVFLMVPKKSLEQIMAMKKSFQQLIKDSESKNFKIPEMHIQFENYFVDIVQNSPELIMDKLMIKTVGEERSYSLTQYQEQWDQFEKEDKEVDDVLEQC